MIYLLQFLILSISLFGSDVTKTSIVSNEHVFIDYASRIIVSKGSASIVARDVSQSGFQITEKNINLSKGENPDEKINSDSKDHAPHAKGCLR